MLEAVLALQLDDLLGLPLVEILRNEAGRCSAYAAIIKVVERAIEAKEIGTEAFDRIELLLGQCKRLGADAPCDTVGFVLNSEEAGRYRFVEVVRLLASREIRNGCRTRHIVL